MKKHIKDYISDFEKELNTPLMNKEADRPLVEYLADSWKSLEIVKNIKFIGYEYDPDESNVDINDYILRRTKKRKKKDPTKFKFIHDDRYASLTVRLEVTANDINPKTKKVEEKTIIIKKKMLVPVEDEDGYYYIKGKRYFLLYQLVDKSTYTTRQCVVLKSLMPISVKRDLMTAEDSEGNSYNLPLYKIYVFKKEIVVLLFYAANGLTYALSYLDVLPIISFTEKIENLEEFIYFPISSKVNLQVNRELFDKYSYVQSIVAMILSITTNRFTLDMIDDKEYWIKKLGNNNYDKGRDILVFFNRLLDETTKKILKLNSYHKENIYALLRWIMQNFNELRSKDNLSLDNKRLRCNEYIASLLTAEFSKRLNRIISMGNKVMMGDFKDIFKFPGDVLLQKMHSSGILRYDDTINDMDFFTKFKFTKKGPNALGNKNENNISIRDRGIHPSFLGHIDILVCGNSDPGTSGVFSPFSKIKGLYFDSSDECDDFLFEFKRDLREIVKKSEIEYIDIEFETREDFYRVFDYIKDLTRDNIQIRGVSKNQHVITIEEELIDDADDDDGENTSPVDGDDSDV